ncbi:MAG: CDP-diacylglycerol--serine O-phosphatidyltransferase [Candidatus Kapabacteria bacterium]|nr:CDP-diacylglycerol--serine O-phosphatidyltransferase [Candidatus Kapabacteria bacterium]MDW7997118.1 CDP-diacylglycerol--serine O-phosphatidyltransferase [Bacteroidota bacterium]
MKFSRQLVPHLFTLANLFAGFHAIVLIAQGQFATGFVFIVLAALFDMLDGVLSRAIGVASDFGVELDSLSDIVSFGVAPAYLAYMVHLHQLGGAGMLLAAVPALAGALRLARFNLQLSSLADKPAFVGLPIPASALTLGSYLVFVHPQHWASPWDTVALSGLVLLLAALMLSRISFPNVPRCNYRYVRQHPLETLVFILGVLLVLVTRGQAFFPLMMIYVVGSVLRDGLKRWRYRRVEEWDAESFSE